MISNGAADEITTSAVNSALNEARAAGNLGTSFEKFSGRTAKMFGEGAQVSEIPAGTKVYRTFDSANPNARPLSNWVSREPPALTSNTVDFLALPQNLQKPVVREFITTQPIKAVEGSIAPATFDIGGSQVARAGGGQQLFVPYELDKLSSVMRQSNDALLTGVGVRGAADMQNISD